MDVKIKNKEIIVRHKLKKSERYKVSKGSKFNTISIFSCPQIVKGFSNVCEDLKGILVIDYDGVDLSIVEEDYLFIQEKFKLPPAYLFTTKEGNYHVISLFKAPQSKIYEILSNTRCDEQFKSMCLRNPFRSYVLRLSTKKGSKKPKFLDVIGHFKHLDKEISSAHYDLISKIYKIIHPRYRKEDNFKKLRLHTYET